MNKNFVRNFIVGFLSLSVMLAVLAATPENVSAQGAGGAISGTVFDSSGAVCCGGDGNCQKYGDRHRNHQRNDGRRNLYDFAAGLRGNTILRSKPIIFRR